MKVTLFLFIVGSFIGWIMEVFFKYFSNQSIENAGMAKGPFCALYGFGTLILYLVISKAASNVLLIFVSSMFFLTILELFAGFFLDKVFNLNLWNYKDKKFSINKYICGEFMITWGVLGVLFVKFILPFLLNIFTKFDTNFGITSIYLILIIMAIDYIISAFKRLESISK